MAWLGGSAFYVVALRGSLASARTEIDRRFRDVVQLCIVTLLVTGAIITFDRLQLQPGPTYAIVLGIKIALAIWMFVVAQDLARRGRRRMIERRLSLQTSAGGGSSSWLVLALGAAVLLLSDLLRVIGPA